VIALVFDYQVFDSRLFSCDRLSAIAGCLREQMFDFGFLQKSAFGFDFAADGQHGRGKNTVFGNFVEALDMLHVGRNS